MSKILLNFLIFSISLFFLSLNGTLAHAAVTPSFPSCSNPQGTLKVSHESGTHGIAGNTQTYTGSDSVYTLSDNTLMQCFCATDGSGVQTNWWKISQLTDEEINILKNEGWIYIPNGALWGLDNTQYLAKNSDFSCKSSSNSSSNNSGGGTSDQVAGASFTASAGNVLGLASTGNLKSILAFLAGGLLALALGSALSQPKKNVK